MVFNKDFKPSVKEIHDVNYICITFKKLFKRYIGITENPIL